MIRFASYEDIDAIMGFIDTYWRQGHIMATNRKLFEYEFLDGDKVHFVLSLIDSKINAILGYIPYTSSSSVFMTSLWKANTDAHSFVGLELLSFLQDKLKPTLMASPGSNPRLEILYKRLNYKFGDMTQWYRLRSQTTYDLAQINDATIPSISINQAPYIELKSWTSFENVFDFEGYKAANPKPYKEPWYIKKRYFDHPIYHYDVYGLYDDAKIVKTAMFFRLEQIGDNRALRLIDCIGDYQLLAGSTALIDDLLMASQAEYIDCYEANLPDLLFVNAGFQKVEGSNNIIPNYYSPFVQKNIAIRYFSSDPDAVLFKGDGDQDRPN